MVIVSETRSRWSGLAASVALAIVAVPWAAGVFNPVSAAAESTYALETYIANTGGQEQVNECAGGLTNLTAVSDYLTRVEGSPKINLPIHNECGGRPILELQDGDLVLIENLGEFVVVADRTVERGGDADDLLGLPGTVLLQTCHDSGNQMRVVALAAVA